MRPIYRAELDRIRFALLLTPEAILPYVSQVTLAPISSIEARLPTHLSVTREDGVDYDSTIKCEEVTTVPIDNLRARVGFLAAEREYELRDAVIAAFGLPPVVDFE